MSIIYEANNCVLIDHRDYISKIYKNVVNGKVLNSHTLLAKLFNIVSENSKSRKRKYNCDRFSVETTKVCKMYEKFIKDLPEDIKVNIKNKYMSMDTSNVRDMSKTLFESTIFDHSGLNGGNNSNAPLKCKVKSEYFLIPPRSRFYCGCIRKYTKLNRTFDIIVADPPWWNKYIRRLNGANDKLSYSMMDNEGIASIPVQKLLAPNCLVAVWCTNSPSNVAAVKNDIFPKWGIKYVATWYWIKVTVDLGTVCHFASENMKQPYERIILGTIGNVKAIPDDRFVVSIPSALHSHKPPLLDLLTPYVTTQNPETLELFARYLLPDTTSIGYEPLKWQHENLYESIS
ncbi:N(6)-adenine-specific methyltransferase METTL4 [Manduca sexta]|uniref:N(6)-adenine-specific methyltransferase METTL4 n=1 Tax=Manduca sexta TaxID=7130 RepID=UPI001890249B|nr:N(6)-adenine-specific methyltransferase METTL4 [Manduca sexta]